MSFNLQIVAGNIGDDPTTRNMPSGDAVTNFSVATSEVWTKDGEKQEKTTWHRVTCFKRLAEVMSEHAKKGRLVLVQGKTDHQKYQDKTTGQDRYSTQIIAEKIQFLGPRPDSNGGNNATGGGSAPQAGGAPQSQANSRQFDDDIPF